MTWFTESGLDLHEGKLHGGAATRPLSYNLQKGDDCH